MTEQEHRNIKDFAKIDAIGDLLYSLDPIDQSLIDNEEFRIVKWSIIKWLQILIEDIQTTKIDERT